MACFSIRGKGLLAKSLELPSISSGGGSSAAGYLTDFGASRADSEVHRWLEADIRLMVQILHDFRYDNPRNYGTTVCIYLYIYIYGRISTINSICRVTIGLFESYVYLDLDWQVGDFPENPPGQLKPEPFHRQGARKGHKRQQGQSAVRRPALGVQRIRVVLLEALWKRLDRPC